MVTLYKGQLLNKTHLNVYISDSNSVLVNPLFITYTIYTRTKSMVPEYTRTYRVDEEPINETIDSTPLPFGIGQYYAPWVMPDDTRLGYYRIKWVIQLNINSQKVEQIENFEILQRVDPLLKSIVTGMDSQNNIVNLPHEHFRGGDAG